MSSDDVKVQDNVVYEYRKAVRTQHNIAYNTVTLRVD